MKHLLRPQLGAIALPKAINTDSYWLFLGRDNKSIEKKELSVKSDVSNYALSRGRDLSS